MIFEPFPLAILTEVGAPVGSLRGWRFELLPFLRWLKAHSASRRVAQVEDGSKLWAPVLPHAVADEGGIVCTQTTTEIAASKGPFDFVHVTAELPADRLAAAVVQIGRSVASDGLMLLLLPHATRLPCPARSPCRSARACAPCSRVGRPLC